MAGYDLKKGDYREEIVSEDELWSTFASLFSSQVIMVSSYKYSFLKAIIDNLYNTDEYLKLTFDQVFSKFTEINWNLILKHKLRQQSKRKTVLEQILLDAENRYSLPKGIPYEGLTPEMMVDINHRVKQKCKKYVIGALFEDTKRLMYSFSKEGEWIKISPQMYDFLCKHKIAIEKLNYYEWARFLERINEKERVDHLLSKIDESAKRNNLSFYRDILFMEFENKCFYCGKNISTGRVEVDHFIPWSFIKDDNLWNFVLSCPECNNKKRDKLADKTYLSNLILRNKKIQMLPEMGHYQNDRLIKIYNWAIKNGYNTIWTPQRQL